MNVILKTARWVLDPTFREKHVAWVFASGLFVVCVTFMGLLALLLLPGVAFLMWSEKRLDEMGAHV